MFIDTAKCICREIAKCNLFHEFTILKLKLCLLYYNCRLICLRIILWLFTIHLNLNRRGPFKICIKTVLLVLILLFDSKIVLSNGEQCIQSKIGSTCTEDNECFEHDEMHLYCNKTKGANVCAFQVETYAGQSEIDKDCPGEEFSAESWSNPISDSILEGSKGIDCMRWCYFTETCFAVTVVDHKCYLKNDKCFSNLESRIGSLLGVMSVVREDYHCGCHYPFTRRRSNGELLAWTPDCPESQLDRNPYRCCSKKGLCVKCAPGENPVPPPVRNDLSIL